VTAPESHLAAQEASPEDATTSDVSPAEPRRSSPEAGSTITGAPASPADENAIPDASGRDPESEAGDPRPAPSGTHSETSQETTPVDLRRGRHAAPRRSRSKQKQGRPPRHDSLRVEGVCTLANPTDGVAAEKDLVLTIDDETLNFLSESGEAVWSSDWSEVALLSTPQRMKTPDGRRGVVMVVAATDDVEHRFVVPAPRPQKLEKALGAIARRHAAAPDRPERPQSKLLAVFLLTVAAAAVAILLLMAGHVVHLR